MKKYEENYYPALPLIGKYWPNLECKYQSFKCSEFSKLSDFFIQISAKIFQSGAVQGIPYGVKMFPTKVITRGTLSNNSIKTLIGRNLN